MTTHSLLHLDHRPSTAVRRLTAVAVAAIIGLFTWGAARLAGDVELAVRSGGALIEIGPIQVLTASAVAALLGVGLLWLLERRADRSRRATLRLWTLLSGVALLVSLAGPLLADAPLSTRTWLLSLHTTVGVAFIAAIRSGGHR